VPWWTRCAPTSRCWSPLLEHASAFASERRHRLGGRTHPRRGLAHTAGLDAGLYCLTAWVGLSLRKRLEALPIAGELLLVLLILLLRSLLAWGIGSLVGVQPSAESHLAAPLVGAVCWPLVRLVLDASGPGRGRAGED
jgi:hypothetical protein